MHIEPIKSRGSLIGPPNNKDCAFGNKEFKNSSQNFLESRSLDNNSGIVG
jgi:hypothetical protein